MRLCLPSLGSVSRLCRAVRACSHDARVPNVFIKRKIVQNYGIVKMTHRATSPPRAHGHLVTMNRGINSLLVHAHEQTHFSPVSRLSPERLSLGRMACSWSSVISELGHFVQPLCACCDSNTLFRNTHLVLFSVGNCSPRGAFLCALVIRLRSRILAETVTRVLLCSVDQVRTVTCLIAHAAQLAARPGCSRPAFSTAELLCPPLGSQVSCGQVVQAYSSI